MIFHKAIGKFIDGSGTDIVLINSNVLAQGSLNAFISGGNQRDLARAKNMKKKEEQSKGKRTDNLTVEQRKLRDAELMREKQRKKEDIAGRRGVSINTNYNK